MNQFKYLFYYNNLIKNSHHYYDLKVPFIFLQNMELLLKLAPSEDIKSDILPMLYKTLELDSKPIQETCLSVIPSLAALVDGPSMKNALLPRIKRLCLSTSDLSVN